MARNSKHVMKALGKLKPTDWKSATPPPRTVVDFKGHIEGKLDYFRFRQDAPIRRIISDPADLFVASNMSNEALMLSVMDNMYQYGRANWTWVRGSPKGTQDAYEDSVKTHMASLEFGEQLRWKKGRGLLDGTVSSGVCGTFNSAFKFLVHEIFDVPNVKVSTGDDTTQISGTFLTLPGSEPIDSGWKGNVWLIGTDDKVSTYSRSNVHIGALCFNGHFFANRNSTIYDVTGNKVHQSGNEMIWCRMTKSDGKIPDFPGARTVYEVQVINASTKSSAAKYCVYMGEEPTSADCFSNWALTDRGIAYSRGNARDWSVVGSRLTRRGVVEPIFPKSRIRRENVNLPTLDQSIANSPVTSA